MDNGDKYAEIAEYYDYMLTRNPEREAFFREVFQKYGVRNILDCACGTGNDLIFFESLGYCVTGADISESMLKAAQQKITKNRAKTALKKADFHHLENRFAAKFDAVVCLSNALNELEVDVIGALESMKKVLNDNGIIIFDQGQTDYTMINPPLYFPEVNNSDLSRLYTMDYEKDVMVVNIFDFIHKTAEGLFDFRRSEFKIRIRLYDEWQDILNQVGLTAHFFGNWGLETYDKAKSQRLIVIAEKK